MENEINYVKNIGDNRDTSFKSSSNKLTFTSEITSEKPKEQNRKVVIPTEVSFLNSSTIVKSNNSPKMGSRRIFTPQFKLQVLESYRNDNDCKGNQRATARKYNIHRRQIQKWLQCESSLRSSVENINHNTVKHQFHNISMQQEQSQKHSISANLSYASSHQHSANVSFDSTRPTMVPSIASASSRQTQGMLASANLATIAAGALSTSSTATPTSVSTTTKTVASPLRPSDIIGDGTNAATMSPLLHHYGIQPYPTAPACGPLSEPIITHHISNIHQQTHQQHQSYQYHNLAYSQVLTHQPENNQSSYLTSVSLPTMNALSTASASTSTTNGFIVEDIDVRDALKLKTVTSLDFSLENKEYIYNDNHTIKYAGCRKSSVDTTNDIYINQYEHYRYPLVFPLLPIDLSLRPRREVKTELLKNVKNNAISNISKDSEISAKKNLYGETNVVDLTYRKRKIPDISSSTDEINIKFSEKQLKLTSEIDHEKMNSNNYRGTEFSIKNVPNIENCNEEDDLDIEVGTEDRSPPSKPIKLFKPYLLDDCEDNDYKCIESEKNNSIEKRLWVNCTKRVSIPPIYSDTRTESCEKNFQASLVDNYTSVHDSSNFLAEVKIGNIRSAFSPTTSIPTLSPINFQCPKGSPVSSGYESSTSTYSESSLSSRSDASVFGQTYNINLHMHTTFNDNNVLHPSKHVQRWLDQEELNPATSNSSIALFV